MKVSNLILAGGFLVGSIFASDISLLLQGSLFLTGLGLFILTIIKVDF